MYLSLYKELASRCRFGTIAGPCSLSSTSCIPPFSPRWGWNDGFSGALDRWYGAQRVQEGLYNHGPDGYPKAADIMPECEPVTDEERARVIRHSFSYDMFDESGRFVFYNRSSESQEHGNLKNPAPWEQQREGHGGDARTDPQIALSHVAKLRRAATCTNEDDTLDARLQALDVDTVVIVGLWSEFCVMATAFRAQSLQYDVLVVLDAVHTATILHDRSLDILHSASAKLVRGCLGCVLEEYFQKDFESDHQSSGSGTTPCVVYLRNCSVKSL